MSKKQCNRNNDKNMNNEFISEETRISSSFKNMPNFIILWSSNQRGKKSNNAYHVGEKGNL